jgi:hypothetical protein
MRLEAQELLNQSMKEPIESKTGGVRRIEFEGIIPIGDL